MSAPIVFIAGSPSPTSRSSLVARAVADTLAAAGLETRSFSLRDFDPGDILFARAEAPAIVAFVEAVKITPAIVLSTPVYKATYTGGLKALVDLVPPDALVGKPALGIGTVRLPEHGQSLATAYAALFGFFRARALDALVVLDSELEGEAASLTLGTAARERLGVSARALRAATLERP
jgi:FMN reductase